MMVHFFFARDVNSEFPILVSAYGVAVVPGNDKRSYEDVEKAVRAKGLLANYQRIDAEPEESCEDAAAESSPRWTGMR